MSGPRIVLDRLTTVPVADVIELLNEPRNARHMPLAGDPFTVASATSWIAAKDAQWDVYGYGPWAVRIDDQFAGWGGFQAEDYGADLGLVLHPHWWGAGPAVALRMLDTGFGDLGLPGVTIALPLSRARLDRVLARWGFANAGETVFDGTPFRLYRAGSSDWKRARRSLDHHA